MPGLFLFFGEEFSAFAYKLPAFLIRQGEDGPGAFGQFFVDEGVGAAEFVLETAGAEDAPVHDGDPVGAGHVGGGDDALGFEQLGVAFGAGVEPEDSSACVVEVDEGEHFAADGFVADPEDEVVAPVHAFGCVGEGEAEGADLFVVHDGNFTVCRAANERRGKMNQRPPSLLSY